MLVETEQAQKQDLSGYYQVMQAIPANIWDELQMISAGMKRDRWRIGEITHGMVEWAKEGKGIALMVDVMDIYEAIARILQYEISPRTVRLYCSIFGFYPEQAREKYSGLPFQRFVDAAVYGDQWEKILDYCLDYVDTHGTSPSTRRLENQFRHTRCNDNNLEYNHPEELSLIMENEQIDQVEEFAKRDYLNAVMMQIQDMRGLINVYPYFEEQRKRLLALMNEFEQIVNELDTE